MKEFFKEMAFILIVSAKIILGIAIITFFATPVIATVILVFSTGSNWWWFLLFACIPFGVAFTRFIGIIVYKYGLD